ncbi:putative enhancer of polycomb-like protein [Clavispora lusitaniae]|uniref:Enhancer of polycomb-like protein n=1 Tax=Clavispora lusitaniae TaxID=36911 RepID=A0ACD0WN98_CLALS|nr:putative enhancer of polycomb-like protein [Clavispora lusitaniae]QFZ34413.1 putative enhancer of polycomb-like protein [Clavispora lusitaniae]QFZ40097.1 putative enhancer of polycomb-like protein [Clavispora lusitaniae]QFZ45779.1 putative enhancer of polycomb-like protein [Clavispora lusitaniae]QFZ51443.1 putative enhancer of polycomb-like protein [Clavispora lusitaniae]
MAILPSNNAANGKASAGARFRQRKISVKVSLPIYNQKEVSGADSELEPSQLHHLNANASSQPRDLHAIETGVDKNEEDEVHLQQVINAAQRVLLGSIKEESKDTKDSSVYIPTPDASKIWEDAPKYYNDQVFLEPESYIKFSATVEDTLGVEYNMDEADEEFFNNVLLKQYPKPLKASDTKRKPEDADSNDTRQCTELEFETICDRFEKTIEEKQPFLSMDPSNILSFKELSNYILEEWNSTTNSDYSHLSTASTLKYISTTTLKENLSKELNFSPFVTTFDKDQSSTSSTRSIPKLIQLFGQPIYDHWKSRKIERKGKAISPTLKFEDPNANEKDNDNDPYICFRRREFRQARKTRRADNLGAERIRLLQKSLKQARELVLSVSKREILKLETWETDFQIFKLRCETKNVKRAVGIKGDDYLFYPHKRKKVVKVEPEEDDDVEVEYTKTRKERKKHSESLHASNKDKSQNSSLQPEASSTQPYVKLPPSKIPDMDLVTVSLVLKEKNEAIKRAVLEKLRKRKEHDKGYVNITYDPYQPFFNISTNKDNKHLELSHIPYSSIAASNFHQINTTNVISEQLKKLLEEAKKPLPGMKTFRGSNGELVPSKPFPHLQTLLSEHLSNHTNTSGYIAQLLANIENNNFSTYSNGFGKQGVAESNSKSEISGPIFRLRKRAGRANRIFIDRRGLNRRPNDAIDEWLNLPDDEENCGSEDVQMEDADSSGSSVTPDAYHCKADVIKRLDSRWRFDDDYPDYDKGVRNPFSLDPSKLNCISDETQSIRFGSMLLSKSYDLLRESAHQRQVLIQQARVRALQQQQQLNRNSQSSHEQPSQNGHVPGVVSGDSVGNAYRKTGPGGFGAQAPNKYSPAVNRALANYTPQQLQAMQHLRQQQQQQQQQQHHQQPQHQQQNQNQSSDQSQRSSQLSPASQPSPQQQNATYFARKQGGGGSSLPPHAGPKLVGQEGSNNSK